MIVLNLRKIANIKAYLSKMTSFKYSKAVMLMLLVTLILGVGTYKLISKANNQANNVIADAANQPAAPVASEQTPDQVPTTIYIVKPGDTLWSIARAYNTYVDTIMALNNLTTDNLSLGQKLVVAGAAPAVSEQASNQVPNTTYTVKSGDTLWSIAQAYNTYVDTIMALNNLTTDNLSLGQQLIVAGTAPAASTKTSTSSDSTAKSNNNKTTTQVASRSGNTTSSGLLAKAAQYLHTPYVWGGTSPRGFDCSGFVQYVYRQYGYNLPRTAADQASVGNKVARKDLKPGDLVYFASGGSIDHIGIYVGGGRFIHSSSPRSGGVIYSSLSESYYAARYAGATRILR